MTRIKSNMILFRISSLFVNDWLTLKWGLGGHDTQEILDKLRFNGNKHCFSAHVLYTHLQETIKTKIQCSIPYFGSNIMQNCFFA